MWKGGSMNARVDGHAEPTKDSEDEFLTGLRLWWSGGTIAIYIVVLALAALYDLFIDPVLARHGWNGASAGILGGVIGGCVFLHSRIVDHETLTLNVLGRGRPRKEHAAYIRSRLMLAVPSGFVMSTVVASIVHNPSPALLTSFGILGGFSCTLLSSLALAAEAGAMRYVSNSIFGRSGSSEHRDQSPAREQTDTSGRGPVRRVLHKARN